MTSTPQPPPASKGTGQDRVPTPREFMKARRPERFSDSHHVPKRVLDRPMLEQHLLTMTSRNEEGLFQNFAVRLAQHEVCPNLRPQTGPTGGGDSKADSETYPVAEAVALRWYEGSPKEAAEERWAVAISATKEWGQKCDADIKKIAGTGRGYTKAFFISSQYIRDKARSERQDRLRQDHGLQVEIFDLNWILDRVFQNRREALAIEELHLPASLSPEIVVGPRDTQRRAELDNAEAAIDQATHDGDFGHTLVETAIEAAILARNLELPRVEVDGRYARAQDLAERYGARGQHFEATYEYAWATYWWFEDYGKFLHLYDLAEKACAGSLNAFDLERMSNLWTILFSAVGRGCISDEDGRLQERAERLQAELERLIADPTRPCAALQARTSRLLIGLALHPESFDDTMHEFAGIVSECQPLAGYPFQSLAEILLELGEHAGERPSYDEVFEAVVQAREARDGEVAAGRTLLERGLQHVRAGRFYDAIAVIGRSLRKLFKHETRSDLIRSLTACSVAYENAGLLWAARGTAVTAAALAANAFHIYNELTRGQARCYEHLKWIELMLGRTPLALAWHELDMSVRYALQSGVPAAARDDIQDQNFDAALAIQILKADLPALRDMAHLPDVLEHLGLDGSSCALIFALGHEEALGIPEAGTPSHTDVFASLLHYQGAENIPPPDLGNQSTLTMQSHVLGCEITAHVENRPECLIVAESLLAALESVLATAVRQRTVSSEPVLRIRVQHTETAEHPFEHKILEVGGRPEIEIGVTGFDPYQLSPADQSKLKDRLFDLIAHATGRIVTMGDPTRMIETVFGEERALERALDFTGSYVTVGNLLGHAPKTSIALWRDDRAKEYPLRRRELWSAGTEITTKPESPPPTRKPAPADAELPEILDTDHVKHTDMKTISLIRIPLWNAAGWTGLAFAFDLTSATPPTIGLIFNEKEPGLEIFRQWREEIGPDDTNDLLRLVLIRGISIRHPLHYRAVIGANFETQPLEGSRFIMNVSRITTMTPESETNLSTYLAIFEQTRSYFLAPAILDKGAPTPHWHPDFTIQKHAIHVREMWQIGPNDPDSVGIRKDDDPIIPPGIDSPPVLAVLAKRKAQQAEEPH